MGPVSKPRSSYLFEPSIPVLFKIFQIIVIIARLPHEAVFRRFLRGFILNYPLIMCQMKRAFQTCKLSRSSFKNDDFRRENVIDQSDQVKAEIWLSLNLNLLTKFSMKSPSKFAMNYVIISAQNPPIIRWKPREVDLFDPIFNSSSDLVNDIAYSSGLGGCRMSWFSV